MNRFFAWGLVLALAGCGDDDAPMTVDGGRDGGIAIDDGGTMTDATTEDAGGPMGLCPAGDALLDPVSGTPRFVVVGSDYTSSVVSLLAADGTVLSDAWIDSGTTAPGLVSTLSGDVAVGSGAAAGTVILIDRQSTDVVSAWCLDGSLVGQLRVRSADSSFSPNPHDAVVVGDTGWVTRNDTNPSGAAEPGDRGGDIFGFDATTMVANGRRVDFSSFEGMTDAGVAYSARPGRLLTNGARLFTVLGRTPTDYSDTDAAASVFVSVDATSSAVESLELTGLRNCDLVDAIPGKEHGSS
ncbi:MAG: hypothetical protein H6720_04140 [Sandaracinus sp.]|nr:hypothetical protein [Sandaracinus sp.]